MDFQTEREMLIDKIEKLDDPDFIHYLNVLLDNLPHTQEKDI